MSPRTPPSAPPARVREALALLERHRSAREIASLARYGITATNPIGVSMSNVQRIAKRLGRDHGLALALWETNRYEARLLATLVDDPAAVTVAQMDRWCRDFDNWAVCDTACFHLFVRSPHAPGRIAPWSAKRGEAQRRAAFALLACLALREPDLPDSPFRDGLRRIERAAGDGRNFVRKAVSWALRAIGRRNAALHAEATRVASRLAASAEPSPRWVGKDALRDLAKHEPRAKPRTRRAARA